MHAVYVTSLGVKENKLIYRQPAGYMGLYVLFGQSMYRTVQGAQTLYCAW